MLIYAALMIAPFATILLPLTMMLAMGIDSTETATFQD
jgi:hypothetical protein